MLLNLTNYSSQPIYRQIVDQVLLRILEDKKLPGEKMDSIGKLSRQHHIGKTSIKKAFNKLAQIGVLQENNEELYCISNIKQRELTQLIERNTQSNKSNSDNELLEAELEAARQIQGGLLPRKLPLNDSIAVSAFSTISNEVGGDFYDFFEINENKYGILIGDASGKGLPAAMLISQIQAIIKSDVSLNRSIDQTVFLTNSYLNKYSAARHFVTMFYGVLDLNESTITYINAGHNYPIILNKKGKVKRLKTSGPALGLMKHASYRKEKLKMYSHDKIFVFTDGLTERMNNENKLFGEENLINILKQIVSVPADKLIEVIVNEIDDFTYDQNIIDDTTFMAINIKKIKEGSE